MRSLNEVFGYSNKSEVNKRLIVLANKFVSVFWKIDLRNFSAKSSLWNNEFLYGVAYHKFHIQFKNKKNAVIKSRQ